jgi:toll-like receptor 13
MIRRFLPEVEYMAGLKVCVHDRDWLAGPAIADNIINSVKASRKVLLVLSNEFAKSQWCQDELAMAYYYLLEQRRDGLVVVLLEGIKDNNMSSLLRHLLTSRTYIRWPKKEKQQKKFWNALTGALKKPNCRPV